MSRWYRWIACFFILGAMQAFGVIDRLVYGTWPGKSGDKVTTAITLMLMVSGTMLYYHAYSRNPAFMRRELRLAFAVLFVLGVTVFWSLDPSATIRQSVIYFFVIIGAIGVATYFTVDQFFNLFRVACLLSAIASVLLSAAAPSAAEMADTGDYIGIFPHKQWLGQVMAAGAFATLHELREGKHSRMWLFANLAVFIGMTLASKSATSLMMVIVFCVLFAGISLYDKKGLGRLMAGVGFAVAGPVLVVVAAYPDMILELLGKDPTLTGRTEVWQYAIDNIVAKPLLGWGYFGFWTMSNPIVVEINDAMHWVVPHSHNGLLELLLSVGIVGTAFFITLFGQAIASAIRCLSTPYRRLGESTIIYYIGILVLSISEPVLLTATQPSTIIFFVTKIMCYRAVQVCGRRHVALTASSQLSSGHGKSLY